MVQEEMGRSQRDTSCPAMKASRRSWRHRRRGRRHRGAAERLDSVGLSPEARRWRRAARAAAPDAGRERSSTRSVRTYVEWLATCPGARRRPDKLDVARCGASSDEDHYDLEKVKKSILEYIAVPQAQGRHEGPDPVLRGPARRGQDLPGRSIARAIGREFVRASLGVHPRRGRGPRHRGPTSARMPGRIHPGDEKAARPTRLFMLTRIDKARATTSRRPVLGALEVLDPEQTTPSAITTSRCPMT